jgi:hypothetical protein
MMSQSWYLKWDLLERKERLQLEKSSRVRNPVFHCTGEGWSFYGRFNSEFGGFFSLAMDSRAFSGELVWFAPLLGEGNNLESILLISPVADLYLSFRMQECRPPSPQDVGMILSSVGDGKLTHLP